MPYKSDAQRRFMHAQHPEIAAKWDAEIRAKKKVAKRMSPEARLRHQKRLQAITSLVGGSTGLTALGALALKKPKTAAKLTTIGAGVGGASAFNFASIQNQEAKKKGPRQNVYVVRNKKQINNIKTGLEPVKKEFTVMDLGMTSTEHSVSKAYSPEGKRYKRLDRYANSASVGAAAMGAGAGVTGLRAVQIKSPRQGGIAAGLGLGGIGLQVASNRIRSYKTGKGASYKPLARRPRD